MTISKKQLADAQTVSYGRGYQNGQDAGYKTAMQSVDAMKAKLELLRTLGKAIDSNSQALTSLATILDNGLTIRN